MILNSKVKWLVIILIILIGYKYINQQDFAILTGTMTLDANSSEGALEGICKNSEITVNYPNGFNKDNCVVCSVCRSGVNCFGFGWTDRVDAMNIFNGVEPINVVLYDKNANENFKNKIRVIAGNLSTSEETITYKIVLMKI